MLYTPIIISTFGTPADGISSTDLLNNSDLNDTMSTGALSFVRMAELRSNKTPSQSSKIDSRTLPRSATRTTTAAAAATATATTEPPLPLIPLAEPRYPLAKPLS
ncbi:unnamed protein product, partial [Rotaria magnacalcarata]